jgi:predicted metal-dependent HD superfamily phosphohydrolase
MTDRARWLRLWSNLGATNYGDETYDFVVRAYAEPRRVYHTLSHIEECLLQFEVALPEFAFSTSQSAAIEISLWLHDLVYFPGRGDNESQSAREAVRLLRLGGVADEVLLGMVPRLILSTTHVDSSPRTEGTEASIVCDIDLSILGSSSERYRHYELQIREEYSRIPRFVYRRARRKILQGFLDRPSIFLMSFFRQKFESPARRNLAAAIENLT